MANVPTERIRNIVLLSHSGAGKTILAEAMLHTAGVTTRLGTVEDGTTASDFEAEEQRRGTSVNTAILNTPWRGHKINVIDTPGYADFRGEVMSGIRVADVAVLVVAGQAGVEVGTGQMWRLTESRDIPTVIYVSKLDRENASFDNTVAALQERFGRHLIPVHVPIGAELEFSGVVDLLKPNPQVPDSVAGDVEDAMERLTEAVAEIDDDLADKYLEGEEITSAEIVEGDETGAARPHPRPHPGRRAAAGAGSFGADGLRGGLSALTRRGRPGRVRRRDRRSPATATAPWPRLCSRRQQTRSSASCPTSGCTAVHSLATSSC